MSPHIELSFDRQHSERTVLLCNDSPFVIATRHRLLHYRHIIARQFYRSTVEPLDQLVVHLSRYQQSFVRFLDGLATGEEPSDVATRTEYCVQIDDSHSHLFFLQRIEQQRVVLECVHTRVDASSDVVTGGAKVLIQQARDITLPVHHTCKRCNMYVVPLEHRSQYVGVRVQVSFDIYSGDVENVSRPHHLREATNDT